MPIEYRKKLVVLQDIVTADDAEALLNWLSSRGEARADLGRCTHLHPANLQVLLAGGVRVSAWPVDSNLAAWLQTALKGAGANGTHGGMGHNSR
jgi:hypothetical protein